MIRGIVIFPRTTSLFFHTKIFARSDFILFGEFESGWKENDIQSKSKKI